MHGNAWTNGDGQDNCLSGYCAGYDQNGGQSGLVADDERGGASAGREQFHYEPQNRACFRAQNAGNLHV